jgi:ribosomal protein S18 acetylase RimI-like enzyme
MASAFEIVPLEESHLPEAAAILARRHRQDRVRQPLLPAACEQESAARAALGALWKCPRAGGVAAVRQGRLIGYLLGDKLISHLMGRTAWIRPGGHGVAPGEDIDLYRDLYAALAARWAEEGCFDHYVLVAAGDQALLNLWFTLGFGQQQAYGVLPLDAYCPPEPLDIGVEIRRAAPEDRYAIHALADTIARYQMGSPVFAPTPPEVIEEDIRPGFVELIEDPDWLLWLASREGRIVGYQGYTPVTDDPAELVIPPGAIELTIAGTVEQVRGSGVGRMLARHGLLHAKEAGYRFCVADWRTTNLLSSRFFPRLGFTPVAFRLTRHIDPRITWAAY